MSSGPDAVVHDAAAATLVSQLADERAAGWSVDGRYLVDVVSAASVDIVSTASRRWEEVRHAGSLGGDRPTSKLGTTTVAEYDATLQSLVALEPEKMSQVVMEGGAAPERLTLVRKARGTEKHKGLAIWTGGGVEDRCITGWLARTLDAATCAVALTAR